MLRVSCGATTDGSISANFSDLYPDVPSLGVVNAARISLGAIIKLKRPGDAAARVKGALAYTLSLVREDFLPDHQKPLIGKLIGGQLSLFLKEDLRSACAHSGLNLPLQIRANTSILSFGANLKVLRDPLRLINADRSAVAAIAADVTSEFVVVSGVALDNEIALSYSGQEVAANTLRACGYYLHLKYVCPSLEAINLDAKLKATAEPVLFFYSHIKYDGESGTVRLDSHGIDWGTVDFPPSPPRGSAPSL